MDVKDIKKVCIVGGGQMGRQIGLGCAINGFDTYVTDTIPATVDAVAAWSATYLAERVAKGKMTAETQETAQSHFFPVKTLEEAAKGADLVIEAIIEEKTAKQELFKKLNGIVSKDTIIATNSSFMVSSMFVDCVDNPSRLANFHYFNPALVMKLIEVVQGPHTSEETAQTLLAFGKANGKTPIWVKKEIDGFIANRLLRAITNEACWLAEEGYASPQDIDTAAENGLNYPMGPFRLLDFTGLDISYLSRKRQFEETGVKSPGFALFEEKYKAGELGRKTGKGFYEYPKK
ncbi:MAG: 3-hydroxyacyl-CoA dehydrogenase family protein [Lachnospiraceae bacterium]|nr:3-hydroxyacyl-CoA dehydrogenase family protein [Lachnospiraceae bacterium]